jgi:hypothetical protein
MAALVAAGAQILQPPEVFEVPVIKSLLFLFEGKGVRVDLCVFLVPVFVLG